MSRRKLFSEVPYIKKGRIELRALGLQDEESLSELVRSPRVYRYLPTFLFEKQYEDIRYVISHLYDICMKESIILGVYLGGWEFCGLAEIYGYRPEAHKVSLGARFHERYWNRGIATEVLHLMVEYLYNETDCDLITVSVMVENEPSNRIAEKNGFIFTTVAEEDWGFGYLVEVNKYFC